MAKNSQKNRKAQPCLRRSPRRASSNLVQGNKTTLSHKEKYKAVQVYIDELVQLKKKSNNAHYRISNSVYTEYLDRIKKTGINWLTIDGLKQRVLQAFKTFRDDIRESSLLMNSSLQQAAAPIEPDHDSVTKKLGRPLGSSYKKKKMLAFNCAVAKNEITKLYYARMLESKKSLEGKVKEGTYDSIFKAVVSKYELPANFKFGYHSARKRIVRGTLEFGADYSKSPLYNVEYKFVQILLALADTGIPVSMGEGMILLQSLIEGTPSQQKLIQMQTTIAKGRKTTPMNPTAIGKISRSYYYNFLGRHKDVLDSNKGRRFELNRTKWTNYRNFLHMYIDVEMLLVEAKLASTLESPVWKNKKNETVNENDSYGCQVTTDLHLPQCCVVMDEVGSDLNMMNDGHLGGMKFLTRKGNTAIINATKKSKRYTVLGLTTLSGEALMCVVIFEGKDRNPVMESGIDMFHPKAKDFEGEITESNIEFFEENYGPGNLFPGGPVCEFEGKEIPTMIRYTEKGSITGEILKDILLTLDHHKVFDTYRENGATPFLLVDGHQSRFSLPFLEYITHPDHPWKVSIGVPYGTAIWQVGDSYQQNGRFKIILNTLKKKLMEYRLDNFTSELELQPTDIMPMINEAWKASFADVEGNLAAIAERGWFPLTRNLLLHPRLRFTMTEEDKEVETELGIVSTMIKDILENNEANNPYEAYHRLNFREGYAANMLDRLVGHHDLESARARNHFKKEMGVSSRSLMKQVKRLTSAGELVRIANTHTIGVNILDELKARKEEMATAEQQKAQKKMETHLKNVAELVNLREVKPNETEWNASELKVAIKAIKTNEDGKTPSLKKDLVNLWQQIKHREVTIFASEDIPASENSSEQEEQIEQVEQNTET